MTGHLSKGDTEAHMNPETLRHYQLSAMRWYMYHPTPMTGASGWSRTEMTQLPIEFATLPIHPTENWSLDPPATIP